MKEISKSQVGCAALKMAGACRKRQEPNLHASQFLGLMIDGILAPFL
ncbi:hypothetical protein [Rhizobium lentis]|nr:hypothetical protein [Rhizobium lentis]MBX4954749.1 hypothetical protein [Rhizobium lentis]MBX5034532.1 hypothetical protein [Rhizobium lentis]